MTAQVPSTDTGPATAPDQPSGGQARAFWIERPGVGTIRRVALAESGPGQVRVRMRYSAISLGTERLVFSGLVPESLYQVMRAPFQEGDFPGPVKYGYTAVGQVEAGAGFEPGQPVFCLHPHQDRFVVPSAAVVPIPPGVPLERAVLAANAETALNAVWDAGLQPGDRVTVIGAGVVGLLTAYFAQKLCGAQVELVDEDPGKGPVAAVMELRFRRPETATPERDVVLHASGNPDGLTRALALAGFEGTIVDLSWYGTRKVTLPLGEAFHARRLRILSSQVGTVAPSKRHRWTTRDRLAYALSLLADSALHALITGEVQFDDLPRVLAELAQDARGALCLRVGYPPPA